MNDTYCTFRLGNNIFGVKARNVLEILTPQNVTRVPLAPPSVAGLINLRGTIVTALEMRCGLNMPPRTQNEPANHVVVRMGADTASLLVDDIGDVLELDSEQFESPPNTVRAETKELISAVCRVGELLVLILNLEKITRLPSGRRK